MQWLSLSPFCAAFAQSASARSQPASLPAFLPSSFSALALEAAVAEAADRAAAAAFPPLWDCPRYRLHRYGAVLRRKKIHLSLEDQVIRGSAIKRNSRIYVHVFVEKMNGRYDGFIPPSLYAKCVKPRGEGVGQGGRERLWSSYLTPPPPSRGTRGLKQKMKLPPARVTDKSPS